MDRVGGGDNIDNIDGFNLDVDPALAAFLERYAPLQDATTASMVVSIAFLSACNAAKYCATNLFDQPLVERKMPYHQLRREEIQRLREEANALSKKLDHQKTVSDFQQGTRRPVAMKHHTSEPAGEKGLWKFIAGREQQHLQKSTEERKALRKLVESKRQEIENIQRVLKAQLQDSKSLIPTQHSESAWHKSH
jgi:hypothetical protein